MCDKIHKNHIAIVEVSENKEFSVAIHYAKWMKEYSKTNFMAI